MGLQLGLRIGFMTGLKSVRELCRNQERIWSLLGAVLVRFRYFKPDPKPPRDPPYKLQKVCTCPSCKISSSVEDEQDFPKTAKSPPDCSRDSPRDPQEAPRSQKVSTVPCFCGFWAKKRQNMSTVPCFCAFRTNKRHTLLHSTTHHDTPRHSTTPYDTL